MAATPIPTNRVQLTLAQLARDCGGRLYGRQPDLRLQGVAIDSRAVPRGGVFFALRGEHFDGHAFLEAVAHAGAAAAVVERGRGSDCPLPCVEVEDARRALGDLAAAHRRRWSGMLIAVTGSAGKTTAKELLAGALQAMGLQTHRTSGNLNNDIGVPMTLLQLEDLHAAAVVEIGTNGPGEIARLTEIVKPRVGVVTSVSEAHTQGLGSLEGVAEEKSSLLRMLEADALAVHPHACAPLEPFLAAVRARRCSFGDAEGADVRLLDVHPDADMRSHCRIDVAGQPVTARLAFLGPAGGLNAAAALAVVRGLYGDEALRPAVDGLEGVQPPPGRLMPRPGRAGTWILDDTYNANPASARASLHAARALADARGGRLVAVLGDMAELGSESRVAHEKLGRFAVELGTALLVTCGREMAAACDAAILEASRERSPDSTRVIHVLDPQEAVGPVRRSTQVGDVVLVKGSRSMRMERVVEALLEEEGGGS